MSLAGVPLRETFQFCNPSTSYIPNPLYKTRAMKRRSIFMDDEKCAPRGKRRYEERMSSKLSNFHINDHNDSNVYVVEELPDWGVEDDILVVDSSNVRIEEPSAGDCTGIVLSNQLRTYIDACNQNNDLSFLKPTKTGMEVVLYRQPLNESPVEEEENDMRDRIVEIDNWIETDDDVQDIPSQYVTFPTEGMSRCGSSSGSSGSISPPVCATMHGINSNGHSYAIADVEVTGEEDSMEID